jgi:hypothetical protein
VGAGQREIHNADGKARSLRLIETAQRHAQRIDEPTPLTAASYATRFVRKVQTEAGTYYEHHPRALNRSTIKPSLLTAAAESRFFLGSGQTRRRSSRRYHGKRTQASITDRKHLLVITPSSLMLVGKVESVGWQGLNKVIVPSGDRTKKLGPRGKLLDE